MNVNIALQIYTIRYDTMKYSFHMCMYLYIHNLKFVYVNKNNA